MLDDSGILTALFSILIVTSTIVFTFYNPPKKKSEEEQPFKLDMSSIEWDESPKENQKEVSGDNSYDTTEKTLTKEKKKDPSLPPISADSKTNEEKPFQSSYYYAHNHLKKTGGYTDGLKAEDYQMNEPKLLKKTSAEGVISKSVVNRGIQINRYLWDDDGNSDGVAKIIIESLPNGADSSSSLTPIENADISKDDVKIKLLGTWGNGLTVQIRRVKEGNEVRNFLFVPRMHGEVEDVKVVVKTKKIIIKLNKKKNPENLKAWPRLPSNLKSNSSVIIDEDEDLFAP